MTRALLLTLLLTACGDKEDDTAPETEADADTDADTDTDTDTDADTDTTAEDCGDGKDNDGDGLIDCEDDDCLDQCTEDCGDGKDNDGDGFIDCEDDECLGEEGCELTSGRYDLTLTTTFQKFPGYNYAVYFGWGEVEDQFGQDAILSGYADVVVQGQHQEAGGGTFTCEGNIYLLSYGSGALGDQGAAYVGGSDGTVDYRFAIAPYTGAGGLTWSSEGCPLSALPPTYWGFYASKHYFARSDDDGATGWTRQYTAGR